MFHFDADDFMTAETAASMVHVTYKNVQPPLLDLQEAIQKQSFFDVDIKPLVVGDPDGRMFFVDENNDRFSNDHCRKNPVYL